MSRQMHLTRFGLCMAILASVTSGACTLVYRRDVQVVPTIGGNDECSTVSAQTRSRLGGILGDIAQRHGMVPCPSLISLKPEIGRICTPWRGINYTLTIRATQLDNGFLIELQEPDTTAVFKARESNRARTIWNDLLARLHAEWPGCVSDEMKPEKYSSEDRKD
jgi:hypothetical protein